jgi:hypothetical protein
MAHWDLSKSPRRLRLSSVIPVGLAVEGVAERLDTS